MLLLYSKKVNHQLSITLFHSEELFYTQWETKLSILSSLSYIPHWTPKDIQKYLYKGEF